MKSIVCLLIVVIACASAAHIPVLERTDLRDDAGQYSHNYLTANGIAATEQGTLKQIGKEVVLVTNGAFSFIGNDGKTYTVQYIADENGFQAFGDHLPVAPVA